MTASEGFTPVREASRTIQLEDVHIRSDGDGRTVEAYAAVFRSRTEVVDQDGHYHEELAPGSFNRTLIRNRPDDFRVLFNHGKTIYGSDAPEFSMPIGVPLEVKADERGLWTATRYLENPLADSVLSAIKGGALKAQSFSGTFRNSKRSWPDGRGRDKLSLITRYEVAMREYGPAVFAAYKDAAILGSRSEALASILVGEEPSGPDPLTLFVRALLSLSPEQRLGFLQQFEGSPLAATAADPETPAGPPEPVAPSDGDPGPADPGPPASGLADQTSDVHRHSARSSLDWRERLREKRARLGV